MKTDNRAARDLAEAKERALRAMRYATKFPDFCRASEPYSTIEWQKKQLEGFREACAPKKE